MSKWVCQGPVADRETILTILSRESLVQGSRCLQKRGKGLEEHLILGGPLGWLDHEAATAALAQSRGHPSSCSVLYLQPPNCTAFQCQVNASHWNLNPMGNESGKCTFALEPLLFRKAQYKLVVCCRHGEASLPRPLDRQGRMTLFCTA